MNLFFNLSLNKQKNCVRVNSNLWRMAWWSDLSFWYSLAMAPSDNEGTRLLSRYVPQNTPGKDRGTGTDNKDFPKDEERVRAYEQQYLENRRRIEELKEEIGKEIEESVASGHIHHLPALEGYKHDMVCGVTIKLLHAEEDYDIILLEGKKGCELKKKRHDQEQYIKVLQGEIKIRSEGEELYLSKTDSVVIFAQQKHKVEFLRDSKVLLVHRPPISYNPMEL